MAPNAKPNQGAWPPDGLCQLAIRDSQLFLCVLCASVVTSLSFDSRFPVLGRQAVDDGAGAAYIIRMGVILTYWRKHPWQRRAVTALLALLAGTIVAVISIPLVQEYRIVRDLGSDVPAVRQEAIVQAWYLAQHSPRLMNRLAATLEEPSDTRFLSVVEVLSHLRKVEGLSVPGLTDVQQDRLDALVFGRTTSEYSRWSIIASIIVTDRDNKHIRALLEMAAGDDDAPVRRLAATLAARLGDGETVGRLMNDASAVVQSGAMIDAALAGQKQHLPAIAERFSGGADTDVVSAAAYALAVMDARPHSSALLARMEALSQKLAAREPAATAPAQGAAATAPTTFPSATSVAATATATASAPAGDPDEILLDRLLHVATLMDDPAVAPSVAQSLGRMLSQWAAPSTAPATTTRPDGPALRTPAMLLHACARHKVAPAAAPAVAVLREAAGKGGVDIAQALAAIEVAGSLDVPARRELYDICRLWTANPAMANLLAAAAMELGRQAALDRAGPSRAECVALLEQAARFQQDPPPGSPQEAIRHTSLPSAAAAAALWRLKAGTEAIRDAAAIDDELAGEAVAWWIGRSPRPAEAMELAMKMCPPLDAPRQQRVLDVQQRTSGAIMMALAARGASADGPAVARLSERLESNEDDYTIKNAYRCGLLILGRDEHQDHLREVLKAGGFNKRRLLTALWASGDKQSLDWLLWNTQISDDDVADYLLADGLDEVLSATAGQLPRVVPAGSGDLRRWQVQILRDAWAIRRASVKVGLERKDQ